MTPDQLAATYRMIAVDGADGTGKTRLVNRLRDQHGFTVIHCARTPDDVDLLTRYQQILDMPGPVTLDRCFLSELVYGPLHHGRSRLTWDDAVALATTLIARQGMFVHLTAAVDTIRRRLLSRDGTAPDPEHVEQLVTAYQRIFAALATHVPVIRVDTTGPDAICG
jgi:deoxyadenosine/deoxycytidine kinase